MLSLHDICKKLFAQTCRHNVLSGMPKVIPRVVKKFGKGFAKMCNYSRKINVMRTTKNNGPPIKISPSPPAPPVLHPVWKFSLLIFGPWRKMTRCIFSFFFLIDFLCAGQYFASFEVSLEFYTLSHREVIFPFCICLGVWRTKIYLQKKSNHLFSGGKL